MKNQDLQQELQKILREKLAEIRSHNPRYSLRAFALKLEINSGTLSSIMSDSRRVSPRMARKILFNLHHGFNLSVSLRPDRQTEIELLEAC